MQVAEEGSKNKLEMDWNCQKVNSYSLRTVWVDQSAASTLWRLIGLQQHTAVFLERAQQRVPKWGWSLPFSLSCVLIVWDEYYFPGKIQLQTSCEGAGQTRSREQRWEGGRGRGGGDGCRNSPQFSQKGKDDFLGRNLKFQSSYPHQSDHTVH